MCTAISFKEKSNFFGRNLDLECSYGEEVIITPRNYGFEYRHSESPMEHMAIIGIGAVLDGYPLYYDAANEAGLAMAGLNFVGNAKFHTEEQDFYNLSQFELIPFILGSCKTVADAKRILLKTRLLRTPFNESTPPSELHFFITDGKDSLTAEPMADGFKVYENEIGVLTNNPPYPYHEQNINNYINLTSAVPENRFSDELRLVRYSRGMGSIGLPADPSSASRFVRAAFTKFNAVKKSDKYEELSEVFHVLESVYQVEGVAKWGDSYEKTQYTSVANLSTGEYFYKTYSNSRITAVKLTEENKAGETLIRFPLRQREDILFENGN
ncbi:MAG: choloylglycine hydrolase [Clostridia bacterium]|nr:choloylglycine hydrolase [Clostridia bacterium]